MKETSTSSPPASQPAARCHPSAPPSPSPSLGPPRPCTPREMWRGGAGKRPGRQASRQALPFFPPPHLAASPPSLGQGKHAAAAPRARHRGGAGGAATLPAARRRRSRWRRRKRPSARARCGVGAARAPPQPRQQRRKAGLFRPPAHAALAVGRHRDTRLARLLLLLLPRCLSPAIGQQRRAAGAARRFHALKERGARDPQHGRALVCRDGHLRRKLAQPCCISRRGGGRDGGGGSKQSIRGWALSPKTCPNLLHGGEEGGREGEGGSKQSIKGGAPSP